MKTLTERSHSQIGLKSIRLDSDCLIQAFISCTMEKQHRAWEMGRKREQKVLEVKKERGGKKMAWEMGKEDGIRAWEHERLQN